MTIYPLYSDPALQAALSSIDEDRLAEDAAGLWRQIVKSLCQGDVYTKIGGLLGTQEQEYQKQAFIAIGNP
jgi:hypothetical protein